MFKIIYLFIHFSYVGLDYDNINTIFLFSKKILHFFPLELYSWLFIYLFIVLRKKSCNILFLFLFFEL